jgi:hypothetical protein
MIIPVGQRKASGEGQKAGEGGPRWRIGACHAEIVKAARNPEMFMITKIVRRFSS